MVLLSCWQQLDPLLDSALPGARCAIRDAARKPAMHGRMLNIKGKEAVCCPPGLEPKRLCIGLNDLTAFIDLIDLNGSNNELLQ